METKFSFMHSFRLTMPRTKLTLLRIKEVDTIWTNGISSSSSSNFPNMTALTSKIFSLHSFHFPVWRIREIVSKRRCHVGKNKKRSRRWKERNYKKRRTNPICVKFNKLLLKVDTRNFLSVLGQRSVAISWNPSNHDLLFSSDKTPQNESWI